MKKLIIKFVRKIIYIILKFCCFPSVKVKDKDIKVFKNIKKEYEFKKIDLVNNNLKIKKNNNLTIIVPVYNVEKLLKKCIESLLNQKTEYKYDIIFINDGSKDKSLEILEQYAKEHKNIKVISQENKGIAAARNVGIKNITGEYVAFVDSDDFVSSDYVQKLLENAYKNNSDIVRCNYYEYSVSDARIVKTGLNMDNVVRENGLGRDILDYKGYPWGGVFKSTLWENIEYPDNYWYEDMIVRMILFRKAKIFSYINDYLYYYCLHENNISKSIEKTTDLRCLDHFFLVSKLSELSNKLELNNKDDLYFNISYEYSVVLWLRTRKIDKDLRKAIFIEACNTINSLGYDSDLNKEEKIVSKIFRKKDFLSWKLYAIYKMLSVKFGVK